MVSGRSFFVSAEEEPPAEPRDRKKMLDNRKKMLDKRSPGIQTNALLFSVHRAPTPVGKEAKDGNASCD
jgi:hypothetical protein